MEMFYLKFFIILLYAPLFLGMEIVVVKLADIQLTLSFEAERVNS